MRTRRHLRGFTLLELLFVIALIEFFVMLFFPPIQQVREEAARASDFRELQNVTVTILMATSSLERDLLDAQAEVDAFRRTGVPPEVRTIAAHEALFEAHARTLIEILNHLGSANPTSAAGRTAIRNLRQGVLTLHFHAQQMARTLRHLRIQLPKLTPPPDDSRGVG